MLQPSEPQHGADVAPSIIAGAIAAIVLLATGAAKPERFPGAAFDAPPEDFSRPVAIELRPVHLAPAKR
jgi:hypothetical protein